MQHRLRPGEITVNAPTADGPSVQFIGSIRTPWTDRASCPRQGQADGPICEIVLDPVWHAALEGVAGYDRLEILYWLDRSRRDLVTQNPKGDGTRFFGTFALRSPQRPNPIGTSIVELLSVSDGVLQVRGLDCLDGTPLLDIKPFRGEFTPKAAAKPCTAPGNA